jgi:hypothetical protein
VSHPERSGSGADSSAIRAPIRPPSGRPLA